MVKKELQFVAYHSVNLENGRNGLKIQFIEDVMRFLDNVLDDFIKKAPESMSNAILQRERSVGLGAMGFHSFLQKKGFHSKARLQKVGILSFQTFKKRGR